MSSQPYACLSTEVLNVDSLVINNGTPLTKLQTITSTITFGELPPGQAQSVNIEVDNIAGADAVLLSKSEAAISNCPGVIYDAYVDYIDDNKFVTIRRFNASSVTFPSSTGVFRLVILGFTPITN